MTKKRLLGLVMFGAVIFSVIIWIVSSNDSSKILSGKKEFVTSGNGCGEQLFNSGDYYLAVNLNYDLRTVNESFPRSKIEISGMNTNIEIEEPRFYGNRINKNDFYIKGWVVFDPISFEESGIYKICISSPTMNLYDLSEYYLIENVGNWGGGVRN